MKTKFFFFLLVFITVTNQIKSQDTYLKGGIGFYTLYESTFYFGKISISPTPIASVGLIWGLSDLFSLNWENSLRLKTVRSEYTGVDTTTLRSGINFYVNDIYFNIDSKVIGIFLISNYEKGKIFVLIGTGVSLSLIYESNLKFINRNVLLKPEYYEKREGRDVSSVFFGNTGILTEVGVGTSYQNFSISTNLLIELFKAYLAYGEKISSSLVQINIIYDL
jgi:hypothetical protein